MERTRTQELYEKNQQEAMLKRVAVEGARERFRLEQSRRTGNVVDGIILSVLSATLYYLGKGIFLAFRSLYRYFKRNDNPIATEYERQVHSSHSDDTDNTTTIRNESAESEYQARLDDAEHEARKIIAGAKAEAERIMARSRLADAKPKSDSTFFQRLPTFAFILISLVIVPIATLLGTIVGATICVAASLISPTDNWVMSLSTLFGLVGSIFLLFRVRRS